MRLKRSMQHVEAQRLELLRRAAEIGPGYRGKRRAATKEELGLVLDGFRALREGPPEHLAMRHEWVDRPAKLFEAGEYPDKGVSLTDEHVVALAESFDLPVPVLIEHAESPLELGYLTNVSARGHELFGNVALTKEAHELIEKSGAKSLSLGLSRDLSRIVEVSLVRTPRIASARLFSGTITFSGELQDQEVVETDVGHADAAAERTTWRAKFDDIKRQLDMTIVQGRVDRLLRSGKISPAQAPVAVALLTCGHEVQFNEASLPVGKLIEQFIELQPAMSLFRELARTPDQESAEHLLLPEEADFYRRHFPSVSLAEIAQRKTANP